MRTDSFPLIQEEMLKAGKNTLVNFDIDEVLLIEKDQARHPHYKDFIIKECIGIKSRHSPEEAENLFSIIWQQGRIELVEPRFAPLINQLLERNIKVITLTNAWTGKFGYIENIEEWRVKILKDLGIDFSRGFPRAKSTIFKSLPEKVPGRPATYLNGMVSTSNLSKELVLESFLAYINYKPKKIIFIDDKYKNLESVEKFTQDKGIEFVGIEYNAVYNIPRKPLDMTRAKFQYKILEKERRWLSDEEADKMLKK
ncbi:MAG: hypothetical protein K0R02_1257 [Rickettsiaceae bacterium]|nr:hypothetical protein [Rickettsiaceae bacterium]